MRLRNYNRLYRIGPIAVQVLLLGGVGLIVTLLPSVEFTVCGQYLIVGFGINWLFGSINVGWMNKGFREAKYETYL